MGIFGSSRQEISPEIEAVFASPPDHDQRQINWARKTVARESADIMRLTANETLLTVAHDKSSASGGVIVVTDARTFTLRKGKVEKSLQHHEVAETGLGSLGESTIVEIESIASQQDYSPNDFMRYSQIIQVKVATPRIGNIICGHIDRRIGA